MRISLIRRHFLAGLAAFAACGKQAIAAQRPGTSPVFTPHPPAGNPLAPVGKTKLYLPTASGGAAGVKFANSPDWVRNTPGWYIPNCLSAGYCMLNFQVKAQYQLHTLIRNFRELPMLLAQAQSLGTRTIYLVDWYEGGWTNKGDYKPRTDMGGESALKDGITALHKAGGRVIFYTEGFIISNTSDVGKRHGKEWSIILSEKPPIQYVKQYPGYFKVCSAVEGFVDHMAAVARRLSEYGADGIFMDSQGWKESVWKCVAKAHNHPLGDPEVYWNGCVNLANRVRAAMHATNPDAIILTEGPTLKRQFEYKDGALDGGIGALVEHWLWDAQGSTDSITTDFSIDDWNQIVAIGAKLACPGQFFDAPPNASAAAFIDAMSAKVQKATASIIVGLAQEAFWGINQWRNSGLLLELRMPGLDDVIAQNKPGADALLGTLIALRPRAVAIDSAIGSKTPPPPTAYVRSLLTARQAIARYVDFGSSVAPVTTNDAQVAAWRFTGGNGFALTAVNVGGTPVNVTFANAKGTWLDGVKNEQYAAQGDSLTVDVPAHGVRLLHPGALPPIKYKPPGGI